MQPTLLELVTWAKQAGKILMSGIGKDIQIDHKSEVDLVTEIDRLSEAF